MASSAEATPAQLERQAEGSAVLAPVRGAERIEALDVLRGLAILAIFYMNIPDMAGPFWLGFWDNANTFGLATPIDRAAYLFVQTFLNGTQRGLLEMLFGAGMLVIGRRAMDPDGPVAVADLFQRRNLWLLFFGLVDVFLLQWYGDIIHGYALTALGLFCFRRVPPKWLLAIGLSFATLQLVGGTIQAVQRHHLYLEGTRLEQLPKAQQAKLSGEDRKTLQKWQEVRAKRLSATPPKDTAERAKSETKARDGSYFDYWAFNIDTYVKLVAGGLLMFTVVEAATTMMVGMALFKWGVLQGRRSARFYLLLGVPCYLIGFWVRYAAAVEHMAPRGDYMLDWPLHEYARFGVTVGHICLVNLLLKVRWGQVLASPFRAAGQLAFTLYFLEQIIGIQIMFNPAAMALPAAPGWSTLVWWASIVIVILLVFANLWVRLVGMGPMEWILRSLAYWKRQPWKLREA